MGVGVVANREAFAPVKRPFTLFLIFVLTTPSWAQISDSDPIGTWSLRWFLVRAVEDGNLSNTGAEAILAHVSQHGPPLAPEEAWRMAGLDVRECSWLVHSEEWHALCQSGSAQPKTVVKGAFTSQQEWAEARTARREWRMQVGSFRGRLRAEEGSDVAGSWAGSTARWTWVLGDHTLGWGQGLTVPRSDPFGLAFFLGSSELRLSTRPTALYHSGFAGGLRGGALEFTGMRWSAGIAAGGGHLGAMVRRTWTRHEWTWTCYQADQQWRWGVDWTGRHGAWDAQAALARHEGKTALRVSWRLARSSSFAVQAGADMGVEQGMWRGEVRGFITWQDPDAKGNVQLRVRGRLEEGGDVRIQGRIRKDHPWKWSFLGTRNEGILGLHWRGDGLRTTWWTGRDPTGTWSSARHLEAQWDLPGGGSWGMFGLDGQATWTGTYVALPALDLRQWSHAPRSGSQMGVWWRSGMKSHPSQPLKYRCSWQASWAPSQQVPFRCAWRLRWEA